MFSTVAYVAPKLCDTFWTGRSNIDSKIKCIQTTACLLDVAGCVTAVVLGVLAICGAGGIPLGAAGGYWLLGIGSAGLLLLALKNIPSVNRVKGT